MEEHHPADGTFQLVPSAAPGVSDFKVARNYGTPRTDFPVAAGTRYDAATNMTQRPHLGGGFDSYVAAQSEPAGTLVVWQYFVASLPTTPTITERIDPLWGKVFDHEYLDLSDNTKPDVADDFSIASGTLSLTMLDGPAVTMLDLTPVTLLGTRKVLTVKEDDMGQGLCKVVVTTVSNASVQKNADVHDPETGLSKVVSTIDVLNSIAPIGFGTRADGYFAEVNPVAHNHWRMVVDKDSTLPSSRATALSWTTHGKIYWPAVLESWRFWTVFNPDNVPVDELFSYSLRDAYAGDVLVDVRKWRQLTPYNTPAPVNMIGSSIRVDGALNSISLPEALHVDFDYDERTYTPYADVDILGNPITTYVVTQSRWHFAATGQTEWPMTVVRVDQTFRNGGYDIVESTYHRPTISPNANTVENSSYLYTDFFA